MKRGLLITALMLSAACSARTPGESRTPEGFTKYEHLFVVAGRSSTAPLYRVQMPAERGKQSFEFDFVYEGLEFDSRTGVALRHYRERRDGRASVHLTEAERDTLYGLLMASEFFDAPPLVGHHTHSAPPISTILVRAQVDSVSNSVTWEPTWPEYNNPGMGSRKPDPQEIWIDAFGIRLQQMLQRRVSYRSLPEEPPTM